jgi:hypothetical protein
MVVHACTPSYLGGGGKRIKIIGVQGQPGQKHRALSEKHIFFKKKILKGKQECKRATVWFKWFSVCLASARPGVQSLTHLNFLKRKEL